MEWVALVVAVVALVVGVAVALQSRRETARVTRSLADTTAALRARDESARQVASRAEAALETARLETARAEATRQELARAQAALEAARAAAARADAGGRNPEAPAASSPSGPWKLSTAGDRFTFRNVSSDILSDIHLLQTNGDVLTAEQPMPAASLSPGQELVFVAHWKYSSPPTAQVLITWRVGDGPQQQHAATLV